MIQVAPPFTAEPTIEEAAADLRSKLLTLCETQYGLAKRMAELGDRRPFQTILRSVQRMLAGDSRVSGEMQAIIGLLIRERERAIYDSAALEWSTDTNGLVRAKVKGFRITLIPERSGWRIEVREDKDDGYCHPWPKFPPNLGEAKIKSMIWLEEAILYLKSV
jgi:hypothetical protein